MQTAAPRSLLLREPSEFLTLPEIAQLRGVWTSTVFRRVVAGKLPGQYVAGLWFVRRVDLEELWPAEPAEPST